MENTNKQFYNLSESEMLALCKQVMKLEPARRDCTVEREDGIDIDAWIMTRARAWYANLLLEAPVSRLPVEDIKNKMVAVNCCEGVVEVIYPSQLVRPVEWKLEGWSHSVSQFAQPGDSIDMQQHNLWTRGGKFNPVAVDHGDRMMLYSIDPQSTPAIELARCVVVPSDGHFVFHRAALPSLESSLTYTSTLF